MRLRSRRRECLRAVIIPITLGGALSVSCLSWAALASGIMEVAQKSRAFSMREATIAPGTTLRFTNQDDFPHQIHIKGPGMEVDSSLQNVGQNVEITFSAPGRFEVRCGIHPRMRMDVQVQ